MEPFIRTSSKLVQGWPRSDMTSLSFDWLTDIGISFSDVARNNSTLFFFFSLFFFKQVARPLPVQVNGPDNVRIAHNSFICYFSPSLNCHHGWKNLFGNLCRRTQDHLSGWVMNQYHNLKGKESISNKTSTTEENPLTYDETNFTVVIIIATCHHSANCVVNDSHYVNFNVLQ